jgi:hypothetical protein
MYLLTKIRYFSQIESFFSAELARLWMSRASDLWSSDLFEALADYRKNREQTIRLIRIEYNSSSSSALRRRSDQCKVDLSHECTSLHLRSSSSDALNVAWWLTSDSQLRRSFNGQLQYRSRYTMLVLTIMNALTEFARRSSEDRVFPVALSHEPSTLI